MFMAETAINTHTYYAYCVRMVKKANEDLQNLQKYLDPTSPNYYPNYIAKLQSLQGTVGAPSDLSTKIQTAQTNFSAYSQREQEARAAISQYLPVLQTLQTNKDFWSAPEAKRSEYLYVLDTESCLDTCTDWVAVGLAAQNGWGVVVNEPSQGCPPYTFSNKTIAYTDDSQTDAVRIWQHNVSLQNLSITDNRSYTTAHRDAIQLIPPPAYKEVTDATGKTVKQKLADQMAGTILDNPSVNACIVRAPNAPLQGIFMSDGLVRNANITSNDITVKGAHAISLAGVLSGTISHNRLYEVSLTGLNLMPRIRLFPLRIGGNMADDGVVCILGFASAQSVDYSNVINTNNQVVRLTGAIENLAVEDLRRSLPEEFRKIGVGLVNFQYDEYFQQYSTWTLQDFKTQDPWGYAQLQAWLTLRIKEYSSGQRAANSPLPPPSTEQRDPKAFGVLDMLRKAQSALQSNSPSYMNTRLADLNETAIRSFTMKRIAIRNGTIAALEDLQGANAYRTAMLQWIVPAQLMS